MSNSAPEIDLVDIEREIAQCKAQIDDSPQSADIHFKLGSLYALQKQWQQAIIYYREALTLKSDCAEIHRHLAAAMEQSGSHSLAANHQFEAFQLQPSLATSQQHYELGRILQAQEKPARAIACYRTAIELQPDFKNAYDTLAQLLNHQGKQERAIETYRQGVRYNPQDSNYYFALASTLAASQKWVRACNNYQRAAELEPSAKVYCHWGLALEQLQQYDRAESCYQKAAELKPSAEVYYRWGLSLEQLQQSARAESCYKQAIYLQPNYAIAYYRLGVLWKERKQWQQALVAYLKFISLDPQHSKTSIEASIDLGWIYRQLEQQDLAIAAYRRAIEQLPEQSDLEAKAFTGYQQALAEHSQPTVDLYYQLGKLLRSRSRFADAIAAYCKSIELDPYFKNAYIDLQYTPIDREQSTWLIEFYRQIVSRHRDLTIAWGNLGDALTRQDRVTEAIECYRTCSYQKAIQAYPQLVQLDWQECKKSGPDFIIAGASKCGTSSIYYYLSRHPQVLLSHTKEIDFFVSNYQHGIDWYLAHFPSLTDRPDFLTGEATPNYLRFPQVAEKIKATFPKTKIIILLRNPIDRAISWHYHKLNTGLTSKDLATAIAMEIERLANTSEAEITNTGFHNPDNIMSSLYIYKIKPWIELLGREQFLILKSEDFYLDPLQTMSQVFHFLDLPNCPLKNYPKVNAGSYNRVDPSLRATLAEYFAPYNQQLEEYLGMKFDWQ